MRIEHASLLQVQQSVGGQSTLVENDVLDVVARLQEIDPNLFVVYQEAGNYFTIVETCKDGKERGVTNVKELTPDVVDYVRMIGSDSWDVVAEMEKMDREADAAREHGFKEKVGEIGERLHHALRRDRGFDKQRIWVPERYGAKL